MESNSGKPQLSLLSSEHRLLRFSSSLNPLFLHKTHHGCAKMAVLILGLLGPSIQLAVSVDLPRPKVQILRFWTSCTTCFSLVVI